jgi:hypothetical protein|tara:strand:+ start:309 stop:443 length:135 start_codon:yes stop_codon:yes gene_type:complete
MRIVETTNNKKKKEEKKEEESLTSPLTHHPKQILDYYIHVAAAK